MKWIMCGLFLYLALVAVTSAYPINATYDQRQNGKVNVHISIKDVAIILQNESGLGGDDDDDINYDIDYDYDHLTVKPNGIWATLGGTATSTAEPPADIPLVSNPPAPSINTGYLPTTDTSALNASHVEGEVSAGDEQNEPILGDTQETEDHKFTPEQHPIPADYIPQRPPTPMDSIAESSHQFHAHTHPSTEAPIIQITSKKPGNRTTNKFAWNGDLEEIPVEVIIEPVLKNKQRQHIVPGVRLRPTRKFARTNGNGKLQNKFGV